MSFIGSDGAPAPKLRDVDFSENYADLEIAYEQVVDMMTRLYKDCHLVHADLSEYNILWQARIAKVIAQYSRGTRIAKKPLKRFHS